jgi:uncharacterized protein YuzE
MARAQTTTLPVTDLQDYLKLVPAARKAPGGTLWTSYDAESDTVYVNFRKPSRATDSEVTDDDVIVRYDGDEVVGLTILRASQR